MGGLRRLVGVLFGRAVPFEIESAAARSSFIRSGFHRAARYPFAASIELTDLQSEKLLTARTTNLSLFGCYVSTTSPLPEGTTVSLGMTHSGAVFTALGEVIYSRPNSGMGVAFTQVEPSSKATLEKWISSLRAK